MGFYRGCHGLRQQDKPKTQVLRSRFEGQSLQDPRVSAGSANRNHGSTWVAVKELKLSYYIGETLIFNIHIYIYTHYGNLTEVP